MNQFTPLPIERQGQKISEFLPIGKVWDAATDGDKNLGKLLQALGMELYRFELGMEVLSNELDINRTDQLIRDWEISVGIPDDCFGISADIETRRTQIITKLRNTRIQTRQDFVDLAALFGVPVQVFPGVPPTFPSTEKEKKFSITVDIPGEFSGEVFPYPEKFPIPFIKNITGLIQCLFEKVKPANVRIIFQYGVNELSNAEIVAVASVSVDHLGVLFNDAPGDFDDTPGNFDDI